ncbi:MAG: cell envelope integrity protein TolA [Candidatus Sulfotelmatobacter sp.]
MAYESDIRAAFELNSEPLEAEDVSTAGSAGGHADYAEILSDTQGVDFGRYLQQVSRDVRANWYQMITEGMEMKKGTVSIEFSVTKYGKIEGMRLAAESGTVPLDRAAWAAIVASDPFPPLPDAFGGANLVLRLRFLYNPNKTDLK